VPLSEAILPSPGEPGGFADDAAALGGHKRC
jgi:hypothetical protein